MRIVRTLVALCVLLQVVNAAKSVRAQQGEDDARKASPRFPVVLVPGELYAHAILCSRSLPISAACVFADRLIAVLAAALASSLPEASQLSRKRSRARLFNSLSVAVAMSSNTAATCAQG